ncbi:hypothetical protein [Clostridium sp.]|nr:hypothetical protein [Clostridium sp.]
MMRKNKVLVREKIVFISNYEKVYIFKWIFKEFYIKDEILR